MLLSASVLSRVVVVDRGGQGRSVRVTFVRHPRFKTTCLVSSSPRSFRYFFLSFALPLRVILESCDVLPFFSSPRLRRGRQVGRSVVVVEQWNRRIPSLGNWLGVSFLCFVVVELQMDPPCNCPPCRGETRARQVRRPSAASPVCLLYRRNLFLVRTPYLERKAPQKEHVKFYLLYTFKFGYYHRLGVTASQCFGENIWMFSLQRPKSIFKGGVCVCACQWGEG